MILSVEADIRRLETKLTDLGRTQVPFATAMALNAVAERAAGDAADEMDRVFDRPTPFTKRGIGTFKARKDRLWATVHVRPVQAKYLRLQVEGGRRMNDKGNRFLPTPVAARLNRYGNFTRGAIAKLLSGEGGARNVFARELENGSVGVFRRMKSGRTKLLLTLDKHQDYEPRYPFQRIVQASVRFNLDREFGRALAKAIATADARAKAKAFGLR